jgi:hypothetical protein
MEAKWVRAVCGGVAGGALGLLNAPRFQFKLHNWLGISAVSLGAGLTIIFAIAAAGAYAGWRTTPRAQR